MAFLGLTALVCLVSPAGCRPPEPVTESGDPAPFLLGGIQVNEPDHDRWTGSLRDVGMNTVAVTVYAHQGEWDRAHLWWDDEDPAVLSEIRAAKAAGLNVVLILRVAVDHAFEQNRFIWHGMILPRDEPEIDAWFDRYRSFAVKWARVAQREGVDLFGIGSEMNALNETVPIGRVDAMQAYWGRMAYEKRYRSRALKFADELERRHLWTRGEARYDTVEQYLEDRYARMAAWARRAHLRDTPGRLRALQSRQRRLLAGWDAVIDDVRSVYDGRLTYAANFDSYDKVGFWDRLDVMGINAYFSLRGGVESGEIEPTDRRRFERRWHSVLDRIERCRRRAGVDEMPVVFTEIGYTYRRHATVEPWAHGGFSIVGWGTRRRNLVVWSEQPIDYQERALALEALADVTAQRPTLDGLLYWKLSTLKEHEAIEPFLLHVGPASTDPLQRALLRFVDGPAVDRVAAASR